MKINPIFAAVTGVVIVSLAVVLAFGASKNDAPNTNNGLLQPSEQAEDLPAKVNGSVSGSLTYPSSGIPDGTTVCARNIDNNEVRCTSEHINDDKFLYKIGYEISLEAGKYEVYAKVNDTDAYYNQYMNELAETGEWGDYDKSRCDELKPLVVEVKAGQKTEDIALGDWYYNTECATS